MDAQAAMLVLVAAIASGALAALKRLAPMLKRYVPNAAWPVAVAALTAVGTQVCDAAGVVCTGSPLEWDATTLTAIVGGFVAVMIHQVTRGVQWVGRWLADEESGEFFQ